MRSKQEFQPYDPHCANEQLVGAYSYVDNNQHSQHCYHTCDNLFMKVIELNSLRSQYIIYVDFIVHVDVAVAKV